MKIQYKGKMNRDRSPVLLYQYPLLVTGFPTLALIGGRLRGGGRPGEITKVLGGWVGGNVGKNFVPRWRCRTNARWADARVARFLAQATPLSKTCHISAILEAKVTAPDHVLHHASQFLPALARILDHHRFAEIPSFRDKPNVSATKQRRFIELALLLPGHVGRDGYVGVEVVLAVGHRAPFCADAAYALRRRRGIEIVLSGQLGSRCRFRAYSSPASGILVSVVTARVPRELATIKRWTMAGCLARG